MATTIIVIALTQPRLSSRCLSDIGIPREVVERFEEQVSDLFHDEEMSKAEGLVNTKETDIMCTDIIQDFYR
jgi:hypothetical protein